MNQLSALAKIRNNMKFTLDDIKLMLIVEQDVSNQKILNARATEIYNTMRRSYYAEVNGNYRERQHTAQVEVELIGFIEPQILVDIEETVKKTLNELEYEIYRCIKAREPSDYIQAQFGISQPTLWRYKNKINTIVYRIINTK